MFGLTKIPLFILRPLFLKKNSKLRSSNDDRTKTNYCWSMTMSNQNDLKEFKQMITTRPSTTAAKEFFSDGGTKNWSSLPQRCERLQNVLETWVSFVFLRWFFSCHIQRSITPPILIYCYYRLNTVKSLRISSAHTESSMFALNVRTQQSTHRRCRAHFLSIATNADNKQ